MTSSDIISLISLNELEAKSSDINSVWRDQLKYIIHTIVSVHISLINTLFLPTKHVQFNSN